MSQETRSGVVVTLTVVGIVVVAVLVGTLVGTGVLLGIGAVLLETGMLVVCKSGKAVVDEIDISCDEVEVEEVNDVVGVMITLVELAMDDTELDTAIKTTF